MIYNKLALASLLSVSVTTAAPAVFGTTNLAVTNNLQAAWYSSNPNEGQPAPSDASSHYICYSNSGPQYPSKSQWLSFEALWQNNAENMKKAWTDEQGRYIPGNIEEEMTALKAQIQEISKSGLDARLILAVVVQESTGRVHAPCSVNPSNKNIINCGIMQAPSGSYSYDNAPGATAAEKIAAMLKDGVFGVNHDRPATVETYGQGSPGLLNYFTGLNVNWLANQGETFNDPYHMLRIYNTGSVNPSKDVNVDGAGNKNSYVCDVANRLTGWNGAEAGRQKKISSCGFSW